MSESIARMDTPGMSDESTHLRPSLATERGLQHWSGLQRQIHTVEVISVTRQTAIGRSVISDVHTVQAYFSDNRGSVGFNGPSDQIITQLHDLKRLGLHRISRVSVILLVCSLPLY